MSMSPKMKTRRMAVVLAVLGVSALTALSASAAGGFTDVPDGHVFEADIQWMKDSGVSKGCNPPANTEYCPEDATTRGHMSAFLHRLATGRIVDAGTLDGHDSSEFVMDGDPIDADTLDGFDSSDFVKTGTAFGDADTLDGKDSSAFLGSTVNVRTNSDSFPIGILTEVRASCNVGEVLIGGGFSSGGLSVNITESYPDGQDWVVSGTATVLASVTAHALCAATG